MIPRALEFFQQFNAGVEISTELRFKYTVSFVTMLSLVFGLCFELPVVVMSLVKLDLLDSNMMRSTRSYAIVIMFVLAAVITPTPDIFTMSLLAGPMVLLYELCIWMAWWLERKTAKREALEREEERKALAKSMEMQKKRENAKEAQSTDESVAVVGTREYDPDNEAVYHDETADDQKAGDGAFDEYHTGLQEDTSPVDPTSDAVWDQSVTEGNADSSGHEHDHHDHHDHHDPYHYDHGYHDDGYYSGPTEELKRSLREDLKGELKEDLKAELKAELKSEIIQEIKQAMENDQQESSS